MFVMIKGSLVKRKIYGMNQISKFTNCLQFPRDDD